MARKDRDMFADLDTDNKVNTAPEVATVPKVEVESSSFMKQFNEKASKPTMEDTHKRTTFLFNRELMDRLDALAQVNPRGFKTEFINAAIEALLDEVESK